MILSLLTQPNNVTDVSNSNIKWSETVAFKLKPDRIYSFTVYFMLAY